MKRDLRRELAGYAAVAGRFDLITVPPLAYLMIDGHGDPNTAPAYRDAVATLYPVAYALKFASRAELDLDYTVMPLEALWWSDDPASFTTDRDKSRWDWTVMILVPDWIGPDLVTAAVRTAERKGGAPALDRLRFEVYDEGPAVQTLHVGSYDDEAPVLAALHQQVIPAHGLRPTGRHHEIYLSDPRRTASERLRTILRQPVGRA